MRILFIGSVVPNCKTDCYRGSSIAGNKMQIDLVKALSKIDGVEVDVVSVEPYQIYPFQKNLFVSSHNGVLADEVQARFCGYINIPLFNDLTIKSSLVRECKKFRNDMIAICYNIFPNTASVVRYLEKHGMKTVCLLADTTFGDCSKTKNIIKKAYYKRRNEKTRNNINNHKHFITLNRNAVTHLSEDKYIVIPGGVDVESYSLKRSYAGTKKTVVYSGALVDYSGIMTLIDAMLLLDDSFELHIYGNGGLKEDVIERSKNISNVYYKGTVSNDEMILIQQSSWCLVNPRPVHDAVAMETFPSKVFEYLMSGRPVISTKLNGFLEEFEPYLIWSGDDKDSLAGSIKKLAQYSEDEIKEIGAKGRNFVIDSYSWNKNVEKIYNYLENVLKE